MVRAALASFHRKQIIPRNKVRRKDPLSLFPNLPSFEASACYWHCRGSVQLARRQAGEAFAATIQADIAKWAKVVNEADIKLD